MNRVGRVELAARLARRVARDPLLRELRAAALAVDAEIWVVGGYVRDAALGRRSDDIDLSGGRRTRLLVRALQELWQTSGFAFRKRGVTTWRFATAGRRIDLVDASRRGLEADLERREATLNAIAFDLRSGTISDPLRGLEDLRRGRLHPPRAGALLEDPLRALRYGRFLAQFPHWRVSTQGTVESTATARRLRRAPAERVRQELDKLLVAARPDRGLRWLAQLGLCRAILPELEPLASCVAGRERPDVWTHTLLTLELSATRPRLPGRTAAAPEDARAVLRWSLLLHDIAKPETLDRHPTDSRPTFHGHEVLGARRADALLRRLRAARPLRRRVSRLIRLHLRPGHLADAGASPRGLRRLVRDAGDDLPLLVFHAACDAQGSGGDDPARWRRLARVLRELLRLHATSDRAVPTLLDGREVMRVAGIAPGPRVGELLARLRELQDDGSVTSAGEARAALRRMIDAN